MSFKVTTRPNVFDYQRIAPHRWPDEIQKLKAAGVQSVQIEVLWGNHEISEGINDFSKRPRLRIERLLNLFGMEKMNVTVVLGFLPREESVPSRFYKMGDPWLVPRALWDGVPYSLVSVPNPHFLIGPYLEFAAEVLSIASLYGSDEGPVKRILFDPGYYSLVINGFDWSRFSNWMSQKYETTAHLNRCYRTHFKDFDSLSKEGTFPLLVERRSWLAAFDFKAWRKQELDQIFSPLVELAVPVGSLFSTAGLSEVYSSPKKLDIQFEGTFIEFYGGQVLPLLAKGMAGESFASHFRLFEYLSFHAKKEEFSFRPFDEEKTGRPIVALSGHYLPRRIKNSLFETVAAGGLVFFPFGFPLYDENLESHQWPSVEKKQFSALVERSIHRAPHGGGEFWAGMPPFPVDQKLWTRLSSLQEAIPNG